MKPQHLKCGADQGGHVWEINKITQTNGNGVKVFSGHHRRCLATYGKSPRAYRPGQGEGMQLHICL